MLRAGSSGDGNFCRACLAGSSRNENTVGRQPGTGRRKVLMLASVASMIDQFNLPNIRLLLGMGYEVHVACNFREGNTCDKKRLRGLKKKLAAMHVAWHQWDCPRSAASLRKCARAYRQLCRLLGQQGFSWMHCHSPVGGALARLAAHRYGVRVVYTAHGFHFYQGAPLRNWLLYYPVEKLLSYWTDVLITVNREDYGFARRRLGAGKVFYIPGVGVDLAEFLSPACLDERLCGASENLQDKRFCGTSENLRNKQLCGASENLWNKQFCGASENLRDARFCEMFGIPQGASVLLSVGELIPRKNHRMVLDALAALGRPDVYYLVCGQGPLRGELRQYAQRRGVGGRVRLAGYQERTGWILENADIFVFPSLQEGLPVALLEAMAAGLPCAVSDIRGNRELVRAGERFAPDSPGGLAGLLGRLLEDGAYRQACGASNRRRVRRYALCRVEARMERIYRAMDSTNI